MRNNKSLILRQLNKKLTSFKTVENVSIPDKGWVYTIRNSLNMTLAQLGKKLGMTRQGVRNLEEREAKGSISLNTLKEVGKALDLKLIYGFTSNFESIDHMVEDRAKKLATKIVMRTHQNMQLENQGNSQEQIQSAIIELAEELKREMRKSLWD